MRVSGKEKYVGNTYLNNEGDEFVVLEYNDKYNVLIEFLRTGSTTRATLANLRSGGVRDRFKPSIYGVGVIGDELCYKDYVALPDYVCWKDMLDRVYNQNSIKVRWYSECVVSDSFKYLSLFRDWTEKQIGFGNEGWQLDKDILFKGNKIYSEDTCCFVPKEINCLFTKSNRIRGNLPIGVTKCGNKYAARMNSYGESVYLGKFITSDKAFFAYKTAKEQYIKEVANKWKDQIDPRVYEALMKYQVEITD